MATDEGLIDIEHPGPGVPLLGQAACPLTPDYHTFLFRRGDTLVIRTHRDVTGSDGQVVLPFGAAKWMVSAITEGFWKSPEEGGFSPRTTRIEETLAGEKLELRRSWGLGGPGEPGFTLTNFSRLTPFGYPQEYSMTDEILINGGLLAILRGVSP
ncbi:MAG TPA: hypothetical protein DD435_01870 [Cyanobacteria bacterium UBA8530]|nr:hypothetical protein [Cyanobacteria bacterium UBA8530]